VARKLAVINHPNLISIYAIERDENNLQGVAMELVQGRSLQQIAADGQFSSNSDDWIDYLIQAVRALQAASKQGILHGDVTPAHILLTDTGLIKVGDFGLERPESQAPAADRPYQPPEGWSTGQPNQQSDMFALAASFCQLISGQLPFSTEPTYKPISISKLTSDCPPRLAQILERMLSARSRDRFRSYRQLLGTLEPLVPGTLEPLKISQRLEGLTFDLAGFMVLFLATFVPLKLMVGLPARQIASVTSLLIFYCYYHLMMRRFGQTIGKMMFRAEVHAFKGGRLRSRTLAWRFLLTYGPPLLLILFQVWIAGLILLLDLLCGYLSRDRRMLHDYLLGTWVVRRGKAKTSGEDDFVEHAPLDDLARDAALESQERIGRTIILGKLGQGGMGEVHRGYDEQLQRQVAVKVFSDTLDPNSDFYDRFVREARILASLSHPNLVQIYSFGQDDKKHYFTMELIQGRSLSQALSLDGALEAKVALRYMLDACRGLEAAQQCGVIHRDVKPSNMILSASGVLKMVDFGLAKGAADGQAELTATGIIMGSPHYMSPEQGRGDAVDHRSDIYSLGASLFHLLTGEYPFTASTPMGIVVKHITDPLPVSKLQLKAPEQLTQIIQKMMQKDPAERYQSYRQLIEAVETLLPSQFIRAGFWSRAASLMFDLMFGALGWLLVGVTFERLLATYVKMLWDKQDLTLLRDSAFWTSLLPYALLLGCLPAIYTTIKLWKTSATPGMSNVDLRLVRRDGTPLGRLQRFCWILMAPETYVLLCQLSLRLPAIWALLLLGLPAVNFVLIMVYNKSIGEFLTRSYLVSD